MTPDLVSVFEWVIGLLSTVLTGWCYIQQNSIRDLRHNQDDMRQRQDDLRESLRLESKGDLQNIRAEITELRRESNAGQRDIRDKLDRLLGGKP